MQEFLENPLNPADVRQLADAYYLYPQQLTQLLQFLRHMPHAHRAVVRRSLLIPSLKKSARANRKPIPAVRIPNLKNRPRLRDPFGNQQFKRSSPILRPRLHHREQRHRPILHAHLN
jgi:hypothetical protein